MRRLPGDTRGILLPGGLVEHVDFQRYAAPDELNGLVDWFWSVRWDLPAGQVHSQPLVPQPGVNISVGNGPPPGFHPPAGPYPLRCVVNGVSTRRSARVLSGAGWNLAAKTSTGGFGAWVSDVAALTDRVVAAGPLLGIDDADLAAKCAAGTLAEGVDRLATVLIELLSRQDPDRIAQAREIAAVAEIAAGDRTIRRVEQLAERAGIGVRTVQRLFAAYAGVPPTYVVRRYRLLEAAELVRDGARVDWAQVAADLGYADQAHLTRDFTCTIGYSPQAYARACRHALDAADAAAR